MHSPITHRNLFCRGVFTICESANSKRPFIMWSTPYYLRCKSLSLLTSLKPFGGETWLCKQVRSILGNFASRLENCIIKCVSTYNLSISLSPVIYFSSPLNWLKIALFLQKFYRRNFGVDWWLQSLLHSVITVKIKHLSCRV